MARRGKALESRNTAERRLAVDSKRPLSVVPGKLGAPRRRGRARRSITSIRRAPTVHRSPRRTPAARYGVPTPLERVRQRRRVGIVSTTFDHDRPVGQRDEGTRHRRLPRPQRRLRPTHAAGGSRGFRPRPSAGRDRAPGVRCQAGLASEPAMERLTPPERHLLAAQSRIRCVAYPRRAKGPGKPGLYEASARGRWRTFRSSIPRTYAADSLRFRSRRLGRRRQDVVLRPTAALQRPPVACARSTCRSSLSMSRSVAASNVPAASRPCRFGPMYRVASTTWTPATFGFRSRSSTTSMSVASWSRRSKAYGTSPPRTAGLSRGPDRGAP